MKLEVKMPYDRPTIHYRDFTMPAGWRWFKAASSGSRMFSTDGSSGPLYSGWLAVAIDPQDERLSYDGDINAAIQRGTAIEVTISSEYQSTSLYTKDWNDSSGEKSATDEFVDSCVLGALETGEGLPNNLFHRRDPPGTYPKPEDFLPVRWHQAKAVPE